MGNVEERLSVLEQKLNSLSHKISELERKIERIEHETESHLAPEIKNRAPATTQHIYLKQAIGTARRDYARKQG